MKITIVSILACTLSVLNGTFVRASEAFQADSIWLPEVEQMYQSDTETPEWINNPAELAVVRGVADGGDQSALAIAVREFIIPRLKNVKSATWSPWERSIAEREIRRWLERSGCIVQQFEKPFYKVVDGERYDAFTREAWLLDLSRANLDSVERGIQRAVYRTKQRKRYTVGTAMAVVVALFCTCWVVFAVLDSLTRGYYIGWLRLAAIATFLISAGLAIRVTQIILRSL